MIAVRGAEGPIVLGRRLGGGGEGDVFAVRRAPGLAAKIYLRDAEPRRAKIEAMLEAGMAAACPLIAFPTAPLFDEQGRFVGFLMRRVSAAKPLHELYAPGARKRAFPSADYRFIVRVATNAARAVAGAHAAGCVIGDINHSGFLIGRDGMVFLIDADSFQTAGHPCRVGVPEYTPPELQGAPLTTATRTADHDAFGLAVLLFQLLFLGRHPFAGVSDGADVTLEDAIARAAFAYGGRAGPLSPPQDAPRLDEIHPAVAALFERTFAPDAAGRRPTAIAWVAALQAFEAALEQCPADVRHWRAGARCPWCRIEARRPVRLFPAPGTPGAAAKPADLQSWRARLRAIRLPERLRYAPPEPLQSSYPAPPTVLSVWLNRLGTAGLAFMMACAVGLVWVSPQTFLMAAPICIYGFNPVRDTLDPKGAARRSLARLDRDLADALTEVQRAAGLDRAWRLKAEIAEALAVAGPVDEPALTRQFGRLEALAAALAEAPTARHERIEILLARRRAQARDAERMGVAPPPPPEAPEILAPESVRKRIARLLA
ncbi:MAG: hypothetical protein ACK4WC_05590 [Rubrimonas sp.]